MGEKKNRPIFLSTKGKKKKNFFPLEKGGNLRRREGLIHLLRKKKPLLHLGPWEQYWIGRVRFPPFPEKEKRLCFVYRKKGQDLRGGGRKK